MIKSYNGGPMMRKRRRIRKAVQDVSAPTVKERRCSVCSSNNCFSTYYGVLCCSSCKQFFRRSIINKRQWKCANNGRCCETGEPQSRILCKSCRIDKCLVVGMDWKLIQVLKKPDFECVFFKRLEEKKRQLQSAKDEKLGLTILDSDTSDCKLLGKLLDVEKSQKQIFTYFFNLPRKFLQFVISDALQNYVVNGPSILGQTHLFPPSKLKNDKNYALCTPDHPLVIKLIAVDRLLTIGVAKTMSVFNGLDPLDQLILIKHLMLPVSAFINSVYSLHFHSTTWKRCEDMESFAFIETKVTHFNSDVRLCELMQRTFVNSMQPFLRMNEISSEEFVLIQAILFSHSAIPELSVQARELLYGECARYTKILLKFEQNRLGAAAGAARFADCLQLIEHSIHVARHLELYTTYKEIFYYHKTIDQCMKSIQF